MKRKREECKHEPSCHREGCHDGGRGGGEGEDCSHDQQEGHQRCNSSTTTNTLKRKRDECMEESHSHRDGCWHEPRKQHLSDLPPSSDTLTFPMASPTPQKSSGPNRIAPFTTDEVKTFLKRKRPKPGKDLKSTHPDLAKQWHPTKKWSLSP